MSAFIGRLFLSYIGLVCTAPNGLAYHFGEYHRKRIEDRSEEKSPTGKLWLKMPVKVSTSSNLYYLLSRIISTQFNTREMDQLFEMV
jgi:hypothetical protein